MQHELKELQMRHGCCRCFQKRPISRETWRCVCLQDRRYFIYVLYLLVAFLLLGSPRLVMREQLVVNGSQCCLRTRITPHGARSVRGLMRCTFHSIWTKWYFNPEATVSDDMEMKVNGIGYLQSNTTVSLVLVDLRYYTQSHGSERDRIRRILNSPNNGSPKNTDSRFYAARHAVYHL